MDPLTAGIYALLILSVCATVLLFNRQLSESNERQLELKREIVELKAIIHELDGEREDVVADGGREREFYDDIDFEHEPE
jgi:Tfp pilus assembly protein PilN